VSAIRFGSQNGQVMVSIGQTKVITQSSLKITNPKQGKPMEGDIRFNLEFGSLNHQAEFVN